ncbi:MAG: aldehyde dehydrogenase family protein [Verrucomicrobiota bacterium]|jgi:glyceraldehyde-3-phosphate dehydrogenase (NADP+)
MNREFEFLIDGHWKTSAHPVEIRSPFNGELAGVTWLAAPEDVESAIAAAARAFRETRRMPVHQRAGVLERIVALLKAHREELARLIALEAAKPIRSARAEVSRTIGTFTDALEECKRIRGEWLPLDLDAASEGCSALVRRFPIGPVTAITPFNFPLNLVAHKVGPALACGNTMLLKPAPQAPLSALRLARIVQEAGAPPGQLDAFFCANELAQTLVTDERIKMLSFTGSAAVGWRLKQISGKKRVALELGGNAAVVIHSDADLDRAAERCAYGGFTHAGQSCISVQRAFVHQPVFDAFADKFLQRVRRLKVGDPLDEETDLGPMISPREAERAESWIAEAVAGGAKVLAGGQRDGAVLQPTVLTRVRPDMKVCRQEVFAPLVVLEPYRDFGEAVARVNDSPYGLQAGLFVRDLKAVFQAYADLEVGGVVWNDVPTYRGDPMPYGGVKDSGLGREGVRYAIEEMTEPKVLVIRQSD